jgi:hypothetical protein
MAEIAKVTDLTKLEGDPDPRRADVPDAQAYLNQMYLKLHARGPWQTGFVQLVARCSESAPVARALVVSILLATGLACAAVVHFIVVGNAPGWVTAAVPVLFVFVPALFYWIMTAMSRRA